MIDPTQAPAGQPAPAPQQGPICIAPAAPGSFVVYPEGGQPSGEPVDLEAALELAREMLSAQGGDDGQKDLEAQANALFEGGFNQASGRTPPQGQL